MERDVFIALGTNLGDRRKNIEKAVSLMDALDGLHVSAVSELLDTEPLGPPQPNYLNCVARCDCSLDPMELLDELQRIENLMGSVRGVRWGPRIIDLDILLFGDLVVEQPRLTIPHPEMLNRWFVLRSMAEIAPEVVHPVAGLSMGELYRRFEKGGDP